MTAKDFTKKILSTRSPKSRLLRWLLYPIKLHQLCSKRNPNSDPGVEIPLKIGLLQVTGRMDSL